MSVVAIPNVSEGRESRVIDALSTQVVQAGARVLDVHSDRVHNRSVLTVDGGDADALVGAMTALAQAASSSIDLTTQHGVHPRVGALDVCPFVPVAVGDPPVALAHRAGHAIYGATGLPIYFYGAAAMRPQISELPAIRAGGLARLIERARGELPPDIGSPDIDPRSGVVCVGARRPLIAFNVIIEGTEIAARAIAAAVRSTGGGPPGVRALGFGIGPGLSQVSMNLIDPDQTGIDDAFAAVERRTSAEGATVRATELVGLVPERYLPDPDARAARLLIEPGRSLESVLSARP